MIHPHLPECALSIMQPWLWLILHAGKRIENRKWDTKFRGRFAIHTGKKVDSDARHDLENCIHPVTGERQTLFLARPDQPMNMGGIVGVATLTGVVTEHSSEWFVGRRGFILEDVEEVSFIPCKGALQFFKWRDYLPA